MAAEKGNKTKGNELQYITDDWYDVSDELQNSLEEEFAYQINNK